MDSEPRPAKYPKLAVVIRLAGLEVERSKIALL
jgi:hypothetical protein